MPKEAYHSPLALCMPPESLLERVCGCGVDVCVWLGWVPAAGKRLTAFIIHRALLQGWSAGHVALECNNMEPSSLLAKGVNFLNAYYCFE